MNMCAPPCRVHRQSEFQQTNDQDDQKITATGEYSGEYDGMLKLLFGVGIQKIQLSSATFDPRNRWHESCIILLRVPNMGILKMARLDLIYLMWDHSDAPFG